MSRSSKRKDLHIDGYERVIHITDEVTGLDAIMAVHNTKLGPAIGGIRFYEYDSYEDQLNDALRLAKASKIKDRKEAYKLLGAQVNLLDGSYICAGDVGTTREDLMNVNFGTSYVAGITLDSSLPTALGVYTGIEALLQFNHKNVNTSSFTIEGMGKVGFKLAQMLIKNGGDVRAYDPYCDVIYKKHGHELGGDIFDLSASAVLRDDSDMYVPCALGATLNMKSLNSMTQKMVCGSANNQFSKDSDVKIAQSLNIQYVPDFVANCGGVVAVAYDFNKKDYTEKLTTELKRTIIQILEESKETGFPAQMIAESIANSRINNEYR
jgi:glutamate dehydrogenase/leucine dehydrogenase